MYVSRRHVADISNFTRMEANNLAIKISSSVQYAYQAFRNYPYLVPSNPSPGAYLHYNFIRKPASDFGWDWGPAIAPVGIHDNVYILASDQPFLTGIHLQQFHNEADSIRLIVEAEIWVPVNTTKPYEVTVILPEVPDLLPVIETIPSLSEGRQAFSITVSATASMHHHPPT